MRGLLEDVVHSRRTARRVLQDRARTCGIESLSDADLMLLVAGRTPGTSSAGTFGQVLDSCAGRSVPDLLGDGWTEAAAVRVAAMLEASRRLVHARRPDRKCIMKADAVTGALADLSLLRHEELWCLPLDPHSRLIGQPRIVTRGDVDGTDAGPRALFRIALSAGATSCIAVHNHPTGDPTPSAADRAVTLRLVAAGRSIDLPLVDHVILGDGGRYVSLRTLEPGLFR